MISRRLMIADSNGRPQWLPGDTTSNPNNPVFEPFHTDPILGGFTSIHVSEESTGWIFVTIWLNNQMVSAPVLLSPGMTVKIRGDKIVPVGVRRAGEVWLQLADNGDDFSHTRSDARASFRGLQSNIYPLTQIPLYTNGPLSNIWCHPNSAPGSATPMVSGTSGSIVGAFLINAVNYTAAHWNNIGVCAFNVDPDTQSVVNVRRFTYNMSASSMGVMPTYFDPWDRIGILAVPSASNPGGAPATVFQIGFEAYNTYSRTAEFGYMSFGSKSELV